MSGRALGYFEPALAVAREQHAQSLRAAKWRGSGAIRVSGIRPAICSVRSTVGSPKGLTRAI